MQETEKLRVLIPHWMEHNDEHAAEFRQWAQKAGEAGADLLTAAEWLEKASESLRTLKGGQVARGDPIQVLSKEKK
ncbi:MAG: hypothetical protein ACUVXE_10020 [Anaerolineae bacterium]